LEANQFFVLFVSFAFSFGFTHWARRRFAEHSFQDQATARSLHIGMKPKVGGLGLLPSVSLSILLDITLMAASKQTQSSGETRHWQLLIWMTPAFLIYVVCFISDRSKVELPAITRLLTFIVASLTFVGLLLGREIGGGIATWLPGVPTDTSSSVPILMICVAGFIAFSVLAFTNFYNFMDGMDGLAGTMGLIGFATLGLSAFHGETHSRLALAATVVSVACLGFLCWNWPKAKVFMGDTGSTFLGFSAAALGWIGTSKSLWHWSFPFLVFFPFWFDASMTLLRRLFRGEKIWRAHREHFYQRAVLSLEGVSMSERHLRVLIPSMILMLISSCVALSQQFDWLGMAGLQPWGALAVLSAIHGATALWVELRYRATLLLTQSEKEVTRRPEP
jgi:UDP-N-acetylmuramyl pentapeptide phosphotransferase/UDP-N-acetylglucosamine-1-phosphate transferase